MKITETVKNSFIFETLGDEELAEVLNITEEKRDDFIGLVEGRPELGAKILLNLAELLTNRLRQSVRMSSG